MTAQPPSRFSLQRASQVLADSADSIQRFLDGTFDVRLFLSYVLKGFSFHILASWSFSLAALVVFCCVVFSRGEARARSSAARGNEARNERPPSSASRFSLQWVLHMLGVAIDSVDTVLRFLDDRTGTFDVYLFLSYILKGFLFNVLASWSYVGAGLVLFYRVSSREREAKLDKKIALARTDAATFKALYEDTGIELPPWITFPDTERAEWVNEVIKQLWPRIGEYAKDYCKHILQPDLASRMKPISFEFSKIHLGDVALMVTGVKVHNRTSRHRITMDVGIVFTGNSSFEVRVAGNESGIKELKISGQLRIMFAPLLSHVPFVRDFQVYFLRKPDCHFKFTKRVKFLRNLEEAIGSWLLKKWVFPNKYSSFDGAISPAILDHMPVILGAPLQGVIRLTSVRAEDLAGKASRCKIALRAQEHEARTVRGSDSSTWSGLSFEYWVEERDSEVVEFEIYDEKKFIGGCELEVQEIYEGKDEEISIQLTDVAGRLCIEATWYDLISENIPLETVEEPCHTAVLVVWVDSVIGLVDKPNTMVRLRVADGHQETTREKEKANDPVFEEDFIFFVKDPREQELRVEVVDTKTDQSLGLRKISIGNLLEEPNLEILGKAYELDGSSASVQLSMSLRIMKSRGSSRDADSGTSSQDVTDAAPTASTEPAAETISVEEEMPAAAPPLMQNSPSAASSVESQDRTTPTSNAGTLGIGRIQLTVKHGPANTLTVVVHQIENLPLGKDGELPDPYVKLMYLLPDRSKDSKRKTRVIKGDCNPKYDEHFEYELAQCALEVSVINKKGRSKSTMGWVRLDCNLPDTSEMPLWYDLTPAADYEWEGGRRSIRRRDGSLRWSFR
nr:extended synaptotagmin-2-like [Penaeus vannamei]